MASGCVGSVDVRIGICIAAAAGWELIIIDRRAAGGYIAVVDVVVGFVQA